MRRFLRRASAIAYKEILHIVRDSRVVYMALAMPAVMLILFGYAVSPDVDHVPIAVVDLDRTRASRRLAEALVAGGSFVRAATTPSSEAERLIRRGQVRAILVVPKGYERDLARGVAGEAQLLVDGSNATVATSAIGYASAIAATLRPDRASPGGVSLTEGPRIRTRFNPGMRSAYGIIPGLIAAILSLVSAMLAALTIAREWEKGSMEQLFATPVGRAEIIIGKLVPYAALGFVQTLLVVSVGSYLFDIPIEGSLALLFGSSALFLIAMLGLGLYLSVATKKQVLAVQYAAIVSFLPVALLSGFLLPIENMPRWLQAVASALPGRYYVSAMRGVMLKGNGLWVELPNVLALAGLALAFLAMGVLKFRRRLG